METKVCNVCNISKPATKDFFYSHARYKDGLTNDCKNCRYQKSQSLEYKSKKKTYQKNYKTNNPESVIDSTKKYYQKNKVKINEYAKNWTIKEYNENPIFKLHACLRASLNHYLKIKSKRTVDYLGCSFDDLRLHLESKFTEGMSWNNHSLDGWHIDHIVPASSAKTEEDVIRLYHYTNLQPLWGTINQSKGNKISKEWNNV